MKKRLIVAVLSILCILLSACSASNPEPIDDIPEKVGISSGNYLNKGLFAQNENDPYYYYTEYAQEGDRSRNGVYRVNSETGESIRLSEHIGSYLNLYDGYLYYETRGDSKYSTIVWRVKCDGSGPAEEYYKCRDGITGGMMIANDMLFTVTPNGLYAGSMRGVDSLTDDDFILLDSKSGDPVVLSDKLYYRTDVDSGMRSYRSRSLNDLTASSTEIFSEYGVGHCVLGHGYIFYLDINYTKMYRVSLSDGSTEEILSLNAYYVPINLYKGHVYYLDGGYVWRCDLNGENLEKVQQESWKEGLSEEERNTYSWYLYIANDTIYIYNSDLGRVVRQIKI